MIQKGFCMICGRRFDADPSREHDDLAHKDCREASTPRILKNLGATNRSIEKGVIMENDKDEKILGSIKRAKAVKVEVKRIIDEDPDLSFLETTPEGHYGIDGSNWIHVSEDDKQAVIDKYGSIWNACIEYAKQDKERLDAYNRGTWNMIGIKAVATIHIPINNAVKIQTIESGGLFGIASDSDDGDIKEVGVDQIDEVKKYLRILCVDNVDNCEIVAV